MPSGQRARCLRKQIHWIQPCSPGCVRSPGQCRCPRTLPACPAPCQDYGQLAWGGCLSLVGAAVCASPPTGLAKVTRGWHCPGRGDEAHSQLPNEGAATPGEAHLDEANGSLGAWAWARGQRLLPRGSPCKGQAWKREAGGSLQGPRGPALGSEMPQPCPEPGAPPRRLSGGRAHMKAVGCSCGAGIDGAALGYQGGSAGVRAAGDIAPR